MRRLVVLLLLALCAAGCATVAPSGGDVDAEGIAPCDQAAFEGECSLIDQPGDYYRGE
jgi:predicted small secreted protein